MTKRVLKFRAWDGRWMHYGGFCIHATGVVVPGVITPEAVMQFTGLLDRNGKEIYEGDIVTHRFENGNNHGAYLIEWDNERHGWLPICKPAEDGYEWDAQSDDDLEVIGNINENPELLKA